jgi:hypothetical protein
MAPFRGSRKQGEFFGGISFWLAVSAYQENVKQQLASMDWSLQLSQAGAAGSFVQIFVTDGRALTHPLRKTLRVANLCRMEDFAEFRRRVSSQQRPGRLKDVAHLSLALSLPRK